MAESIGRARRQTAASGLGFSVSRSSGFPLPMAHFRVFLDRDEIDVESISPLHWADSAHSDPDLRQTVVLRRAVGSDRTLYNWRAAIAAGKADVREVTIVQLASPDGKAVNIWLLKDAVAVRWTGPVFDARSGEIAYEELEVRYESIVWRSRV